MSVRIGVLGPFRLSVDGRDVPVPAGKQRVLMAALAVRANQPVSLDEAVEALWDGRPPPAAEAGVRNYVKRLRQALGPAAVSRLETGRGGYRLSLDANECDLLEFEHGVRAAFALPETDWAGRRSALAGALGLWRGRALADIESQTLRDGCLPGLEQLRSEALERRIEADLHLGAHERIVPELRELIREYPLRERFSVLLMQALAQGGRQAEALDVYRNARRVLVQELGVEPGPELRELQQRILAGDMELFTQACSANAAQSARVAVPRQLPSAIRHFVGRSGEATALSEMLIGNAETRGAVVISAIGGTAGIGKTALAVHWAHQVADQFPDGQLYVNLRGFDPAWPPLAPADAVHRFLIALGIPAPHIPVDPDEQAALYRSELADRRMLVLLDNVRDADQVRPLLPGAAGCLVLLTSRSPLTDLVALDGAIPLTLGLFTAQEALELLSRRLGPERVTREQRAVEELIDLCARMPLALNIAAACAALHPKQQLSAFVEDLREASPRLSVLSAGPGAADVRAVFSWSYRALDPESARVFRLLGLHPGSDIGVTAAASLTALDVEATRSALDTLVTAGLVAEHSPGRYGFHDLLRAYATDQARVHDSESERDDALWRVCDFYIRTAHHADRLLAPYHPAIELEPPAPGTHTHQLADASAAMAWFDVEHPNLLAVQHAAISHAWHDAVWQLAWGLDHYHYRRGYLCEALAMWQAALEAVEHLPSPAVRILVHQSLGRSYAELGRYKETIEHVNRALALADQHADPVQQAYGHLVLMRAWEQHGDDRQALHHATRARDLFETLDEPVSQAMASNAVGRLAAHLGDYNTARAHCEAALALHRRHHDLVGEMAVLRSLGYIDHRTGHHLQAIDHYQRALALLHSQSHTDAVADVLEHLGRPYAALGKIDQARAVWCQAQEMYRQLERAEEVERVQHELAALDRSGTR